MRTVIIGSGSWGTALGQVLADNQQDVIVYGRNQAEVSDINENHHNTKYFKETELNPLLTATQDLSVVEGADFVLLAVPTIAIEDM